MKPIFHPFVWIRLLRVEQWTKNAVVLAAFLFALGDRHQDLTWRMGWKSLLAVLAFALLSSAVYIVNDWRDAPRDRLHPVKRHRPIAAGLVPVPLALFVAALLAAIALTGAWLLHPAPPLFAGVLLTYLLLQIAYTAGLKRVPLLDVILIAVGFVLRALAGAVVLDVTISPWLVLCAFFLALFLALCKRRHEKAALAPGATPSATRAALDGYSRHLLDHLIAVSASTVLVSYSIYTLWPDTVAKFGTPYLGLTIPFVVFGLFRYLDLVFRHEKGERPERILLTDMPLIIDVLLFGLAALAVFFWPF